MITIQGEFIIGTDIEEAFTEAMRVSQILNCCIEFKFNDVICWAYPEGKIMNGVSSYRQALKANNRYKFAQT
jgi:hypothetical protein